MSTVSVGSLLPRVHAVLVGIDSYKFAWSDLQYSEADVNGLAQTLQQDCDWAAAAIHPLVGSRAKIKVVRDTLKEALESATSDELVLIYLSGHAELTAKDELFLIAWDSKPETLSASALLANTLLDQMDASPAGYVILILDCCYAGAIGGPLNRLQHLWNLNGKPRLSRGLGRAVIASCWHDELSSERRLDAPDIPRKSGQQYGSSGHGVFTYHLMKGLRGGGEELLAVNKFGEVDAASLSDYVRRQLRGEQTPEFFSRGTFPVLVKRREWMGEVPMEPNRVSGRSHPTQRAVAKQLWQRTAFASSVTACELLPDGSRIAIALDDGSFGVISTSDGANLEQLIPPRSSSVIRRLACSPNSGSVVLATEDRRTGMYTISLQSLTGESESTRLEPWAAPVNRLVFSPISQLVAAIAANSATNALGGVYVWDTQGNTFARLTRDEMSSIAVKDFSFCFPDGKRLVAVLDKRPDIYLWDVNAENREAGSSKALKLLTRSDWDKGAEAVLVATSANDKAVASVVLEKDGRVCIWSLPDGNAINEAVPLQGVPTALTFNPTSNSIACGSSSNVYLIRLNAKQQPEYVTPSVFSSRVSSVVFSPDPSSNLVGAAAADGEVRVWDYTTGREVPLEVSGGANRQLVKRPQIARETQIRFSKEGTKMLIVSRAAALLEMWQLDWLQQP